MEPNSELLLKLRHRRTRMGEEPSLVDIVNTLPEQDGAQALDLLADVKVKQRRIVFEGSENRSANKKDVLGDSPGEVDTVQELLRSSPSPCRSSAGAVPVRCSPSPCKSTPKMSPSRSTSPGAKREDAPTSPSGSASLPSMELGRRVMEAICEESSCMEVAAKDGVDDSTVSTQGDAELEPTSHFSLLASSQDEATQQKLETSLDESAASDEPLEYAALDFFHSLPAEFVLKLKGNLESNEKEIRHLRRENRQLRELFEMKAKADKLKSERRKKSSSSATSDLETQTPQKDTFEVFEDQPSSTRQHSTTSASPREAIGRSCLAEDAAPSPSPSKAIGRSFLAEEAAPSPSPSKVAKRVDETPARSSSHKKVTRREEGTPAQSSSPKKVAKPEGTPARSPSPKQVVKLVVTPARSSSPKKAGDDVGPVTVWRPRKVAALEVGASRPVAVKNIPLPASPGFSPPVPPGPPRGIVQGLSSVATSTRQVIVQPPSCTTPMPPPSTNTTHLGSPPQRLVQTPLTAPIMAIQSPPTASSSTCTPPRQNQMQLPTWRAAPPVSSRILSFEATAAPALDAGELTKLRARAERAEVTTAQAQISQLSDALRAANEKRLRQDVERWALLHEAMRELSRQPEASLQTEHACSPERAAPWHGGIAASTQRAFKSICRSSSADVETRRNTPMRSPSANRQARAHMYGPSRSPTRGDRRTASSPVGRSPGPKRNAGPRRSLSAGARPTNQAHRSSSRSSAGMGRHRTGMR